MSIEVTAETFYKLLNSKNFTYTKKLESSHKHYYYSSELDQQGIIIYNFTSSKTIKQYYLTDINA